MTIDEKKGKKVLIRKNIVIPVTILALAVLFAGCILLGANDEYASVLKANWGIDIPAVYTIEYSQEEEQSIFGDGDRYHVLSAKGDFPGKILEEALSSKMSIAQSGDTAVKIMQSLKVPAEKMPQNIGRTFVKRNNESECVYILVSKDKQKLYVVERFI